MQKEKRICCRITPRRIMGAILLAATVVNLITVGAVFKATVPLTAPTTTETQTISPLSGTMTFVVSTATEGDTPTMTSVPTGTTTQTLTFTPTYTPSLTSTDTSTSTFTNTPSPSPTSCTPMYGWPVYVVQPGDWLLAIARATGSSDKQLQQANCLVDSKIYPGQRLYVPRLPITPTVATSTPTDTPSDFKLVDSMACEPPINTFLSVAVYDPQGVQSVAVWFYTSKDAFISQISMYPDGSIYYGSGAISQQYTIYDIDHYNFVATDTLKNITVSPSYKDRTSSCDPPPQ